MWVAPTLKSSIRTFIEDTAGHEKIEAQRIVGEDELDVVHHDHVPVNEKSAFIELLGPGVGIHGDLDTRDAGDGHRIPVFVELV